MDKQAAMEIIREIATDLSELGGRAYFAGGHVRDKLLGIDSGDIDIAVEGLPFESVLGVLSKRAEKFTPQPVGGKFACVIAEIAGLKVDFALCRAERKMGEAHSEFDLSFDVSIQEDLKRRDLRINAMAIDVLTGELFDPFGGRSDLLKRVADNVSFEFDEDPVRTIRAARFISRFRLAATTRLKATCLFMDSASVPAEMAGEEFKKMVRQAADFKLFFDFLNDVGWISPHFKEFKKRLGKVGSAKAEGSFEFRLISLLSVLGPKDSKKFLRRNKVFSEKKIKAIACVLKEKNKLLSFSESYCNGDKLPLIKFLRRLEKAGLSFESFVALNGGEGGFLSEAALREQAGLKPIISGADLISAGLKPGPAFKEILRSCLDAQDRDELTKLNKKGFLEKVVGKLRG